MIQIRVDSKPRIGFCCGCGRMVKIQGMGWWQKKGRWLRRCSQCRSMTAADTNFHKRKRRGVVFKREYRLENRARRFIRRFKREWLYD
jgi:hypothetical protein